MGKSDSKDNKSPATGKVSFVDDWLSSKAINTFGAESQDRTKV
jgi:hypothetical protein